MKSLKKSNPQLEQRSRFEQTARELGVELDEEKLKETLRVIAEDRAHAKSDRKAGVENAKTGKEE